MGHAFPGRPRVWLKYAGHNQKEVLTREAKGRGVRIENHLPITDVITDGGEVVGAIGLSIRKEEPVLKLFRAKSVILATGSASRLYPPAPSPGWIFNTAFCPSCTGAAQATAYRAGAKLVNMEFPNRHAGPKFMARCGKSSWIGIFKDPQGAPIGPFVTKPTRELGDITSDVWNSVFTDMHRSGRGPVYIDCSQTAEEDIEYMLWGMENEGLTGMLNYMNEEGIDVRKHMVEFMQYEPHLIGRGVDIDLNGERAASPDYLPLATLWGISGQTSPVRPCSAGLPATARQRGHRASADLKRQRPVLSWRRGRNSTPGSLKEKMARPGRRRTWPFSSS